jgi:hypothetical protein
MSVEDTHECFRVQLLYTSDAFKHRSLQVSEEHSHDLQSFLSILASSFDSMSLLLIFSFTNNKKMICMKAETF